jgi:hypothetical protein
MCCEPQLDHVSLMPTFKVLEGRPVSACHEKLCCLVAMGEVNGIDLSPLRREAAIKTPLSIR